MYMTELATSSICGIGPTWYLSLESKGISADRLVAEGEGDHDSITTLTAGLKAEA
jgi:hypothetical protein